MFVLPLLYQGAKDLTVQGAPTEGRRRMFQTSANPIPRPDTMSLKKSATANGLNGRFIWFNVRRPTQAATPQLPQEEVGVKKSSTAERPVEARRGLITVHDSIESILNFKTHPNLEEAKITQQGNLFSRVLHDQDRLLYGKGQSISRKLVVPNPDVVAFQRNKKYRDFIPRPQRQRPVASLSGRKRNLEFPHDTSNILRRKTLLYTEPAYRPTGGTRVGKEVHIDPRQLVSILGDPLPYRRTNIANHNTPSVVSKRVQVSRMERRKKGNRKPHFKDPVIHGLRLENSDQDMKDIDPFYSQDLDSNYMPLDGELIRRDPSEHNMLERLLDDYSPSFGTRDEKSEKESTIKQIEELNTQNSVLPKDYEFTDLPSEFANMEVSEGDLPWYDRLNEGGINIRKSKITRKKDKGRGHNNAILSSKEHFGHVKIHKRRKGAGSAKLAPRFPRHSRWNLKRKFHHRGTTGTKHHQAFSSFHPKQRKIKRSLRHHRHNHRWRPSYLHVRSPQMSPYYDYPSFIHFHRFPSLYRYPSLHRWPKFPLSSMAESFVPFARLPKISEFSPQPLDRLERLPPPPPIPPAIMDREEAGTREEEPIDEWAPFPEPIPEPEPPPIPELAPIKEIPPISEPQEPAPDNLDPKKTFDTGESNGGVKKSSSP